MGITDARWRPALGTVAFSLVVSLGSWELIARAANQAQPPISFKAGVELVRLDIQVTDDDGRPIRDLRQDEVEVVESGERRPVVFFQHISEPTESFDEAASHTITSEVSTNQGAAHGHLYVLVFDETHVLQGHEERARRAAQRFLERNIRRGDRVALYALGGPGPQIGFTADVAHLSRALSAVRGTADLQQQGATATMTGQEAFQIVRGDELTLRAVTQRVTASSPAVDVSGRTHEESDRELTNSVREDANAIAEKTDVETRRTLAMLTDILRGMRSVEGRKTVLLFSEGFYGDRVQRELEDVAAAAAQSYSIIHAVDLSDHLGNVTGDSPNPLDVAKNVSDALTPLGSLAAETDGRLLIDASGRVDAILTEVAGQSQDYYLIGFTPRDRPAAGGGSYHHVNVRVRRPGARVSARRGYARDTGVPLPRRDALDRALRAPFPLQGLPIRYTTYTMRGAGVGWQRVILSLEADLPPASAAGGRTADVVFVVRSAGDGRVAASGADVMLPAETPDAASSIGVGRYHVQFELAPGDYVMRVAVREPGGLVGSADRRLTIRALDGPSLTTGDLVLSSIRGELPVRPLAYSNDGLTGLVELYGRTPEQLLNARVTIDLVPIGETSAVVSGVCDLQEVRPIAGGVAREARIEWPLQSVAAGPYLARARVSNGNDTIAEVAREVDVRTGSRPATGDAPSDGFDPRPIVDGTLARQFMTALANASSPIAKTAALALDRFAARDYPSAVAAFQRVVDGDPTNADAAFLLGWAFHGAGDDREAISAWRRAAFVNPRLIPAHLALAETYVRLQQPALAIQALRAALKAVPDSPELVDMLSRLERQ